MAAIAPKVAQLTCLKLEVRQLFENSSTIRQRETGLPVTEFPQHLFRPLRRSDVTCVVCGVWYVVCGVCDPSTTCLVCVGISWYRSFAMIPPPLVKA